MGKIKQAIQYFLIYLLKGYQIIISPLLGSHCRFSPTCSQYAMEAIRMHGIFYGIFLTTKRILRCHPWHRGGYDPVPKTK